jgi:acetolactate synthase-1/2/3 large subunit
MITHMLDSIGQRGQIRLVSVRHEQAAAFAADGYGRMTGVPGVAMATSGPGATNLLTGIGSCYFDSTPAVFLTGQVNRNEQKKERPIRQLGFQETDIVRVAAPITKHACQVQQPEELPAVLDRAFALAVDGRPGPVLVDVPMDVQRAEIQPGSASSAPSAENHATVDFAPLLQALEKAKRPLILAGGGVRAGRAIRQFRSLTARLGIPVVHSLMAVDVLPSSNPLRVGMIGSYGNRWANLALGQSDLLLVMGSRLDVRQTGSQTADFKAGREIFHFDCEPGEINNRVAGCHPIVGELRNVIDELEQFLRAAGFQAEYESWRGAIEDLRTCWPDTAELRDAPGINPNAFMHELAKRSRRAAAYIVDVGQHQMWAAQSLEIESEQRFLTSGGMGSMGFSLPAAIGAAVASDGQPLVVVAGDGGFQCNIQELQTVLHLGLPLKIVVVNNRCHGMVRQFQQSYFEGRYQSTYWGYSAPDFAEVAKAYGICGATIANPPEVEGGLDWLWDDPTKPKLLQVMIDTSANAFPKIAFGKPITEMEPFSRPVDMEGT